MGACADKNKTSRAHTDDFSFGRRVVVVVAIVTTSRLRRARLSVTVFSSVFFSFFKYTITQKRRVPDPEHSRAEVILYVFEIITSLVVVIICYFTGWRTLTKCMPTKSIVIIRYHCPFMRACVRSRSFTKNNTYARVDTEIAAV